MKADEMYELQIRKDKAEKKMADANRDAELMREKLQRQRLIQKNPDKIKY